MDFMYSMVGFFAGGGIFMFPIALVAAVGAAIAIERYVTLDAARRREPQAPGAEVQPLLASGDFDKAREMTEQGATRRSRRCWRWASPGRAPCGAARTSRWRWKRA